MPLKFLLIPLLALASISSLRAAEDVPPEQLSAAELKAKHAEAEYVQALIELEQLKSQNKLAKLEERLAKVKEFLASKGEDENAGFIKQWLVLGPIPVGEKVDDHNEESCKEYLDRAYIESRATPKADEKTTLDKTEFTWKTADAEDYFLDLGKVAEDAGKSSEHAAFVGVVYLYRDEDLNNVKLAIGSDDDSIWRLNGKEVIRVYEGRGIGRDENTSDELELKKGLNILTFTVLNASGPAAAAARFIDSEGKPVTGLKFTVTAPGP